MSHQGRLVLVVDDNPTNLKLARDVLQAAGFRTLEATTGADALELATLHLPDLVLMDIRLPDMDGGDAARTLAEAAPTSGIPVVALTSLALEDWGGEAAFVGYLVKPIDVELFPEQVQGYFRA
jgi:two-component system cell cycle response regulator DivK